MIETYEGVIADIFDRKLNEINIKMFYDNNMLCYEINGLVFERYSLLAFISKVNNKKDALSLLKMSDYLFTRENDSSYDTLSDMIWDNIYYKNENKDEIYYQEIFKLNVKRILGESYNLIENKKQFHARPDAWVIYGNIEIPVEMKIDLFNNSALEQLKNYMKIYNSKNGIAIGKGFSVEFPNNIRFIDISEIKKYDKGF